ncbi:TonB-dependent receptor [Hallella multisaccharivorax]|uniref:TonB-dependent receptor n=1 Tax=Hallella multisaccharivorax TaxID=310514 RepID=UPI0036119F81
MYKIKETFSPFLSKKENGMGRIIRISIFLLFICVLNISGKNDSLPSRITISVNNSTIISVINRIEHNEGYVFIFNEDVRKELNRRITFDGRDMSVVAVLNSIFSNTDIAYKISERQITLYKQKGLKKTTLASQRLSDTHASSDKITVQGKVIDKQTKEGLIGATVTIKGLSKGTVTDINGNFSMTVPYADAILVVSYVGYQPKEIHIEGRRNIEVNMIEDSKALEEVVAVGYTRQRKETLTGAVATITTRDLTQSPTANINNALAGRLPGLIANQYSGGEPGVDKAEIFIRGKATFNDQSPIVIIDGVEREMSYLSADEIETFTILKDASATAQYGIRGANGVVVITTKRGQANERAMVNFKASFGFDKAVKYPSYLGSADYAMLFNEAMTNDAKMNGYSDTEIAKLPLFSQKAIDAFRNGEGYNWDYFNYAFKTAPQQDYTLSIQGGSDKVQYFVMANYFTQGTNFRYMSEANNGANGKFDRYNIRSNIDINITKDFYARFDIGGRITDRTSPGTSASKIVTLANTQPPMLPITLEPTGNPANDQIFANNPRGVLFGTQTYRYNILGELTRTGYQNEKNTYFEGTLTLGHRLDFITPGLKVEGSFSYDFHGCRWIKRDVPYYGEGYKNFPGYATFEPTEGIDVYMDPTTPYTGTYGGGNKYTIDQTRNNSVDNKNQETKYYAQFKIEYNHTFNNIHEVTAMFLANRSERTVGNDPYYRYQGMTGHATYNYRRTYLSEFSFGYNGSENFARGKRYGFFPSASLGWVITNEKFMAKTTSWLDYLKLRASYGLVGSDKLPSDRFAYLAYYENADSYSFGPTLDNWLRGNKESRLANASLTWEKAKKTNFGIDVTMLNQRLSLTFDYFIENRYNILTNLNTNAGDDIQRIDYPGIVGKSAPYINSSKVRNHGFDMEINWRDHVGKDLHYYIKPNFTFARNKIVFTNEIDWGTNTWRKATGKSMYTNFCYVFDHFVADQAEADALNKSGIQAAAGKLIPGDVVYKDLNGDNVIDDKDRAATGYPRSPEIMFGIPIGISYKGVDFSVLFQGAAHTSIQLTGAAIYDFPNFDQDKMGKVKPIHLQRWTPETAETAKYPALHLGTHLNNKNGHSSLFLYDGQYVRLKNIEVGYSLPYNIIKIANLQQVRFYIQGQNLITWDKLDDADVDPETSSNGTWYPIQKTINFGVNITF